MVENQPNLKKKNKQYELLLIIYKKDVIFELHPFFLPYFY